MSGEAAGDTRQIDVGRVKTWMDLVRFSHTLFALPFAVMALFLAYEDRLPDWRVAGLVILCMVFARTAAMAYNRLVDADIDAKNPRTAGRHLPAGRVSRMEVIGLVLGSAAAFILCTWLLNSLAFALAVPTLVVLLGYSHTKRFTSASHFVLGLALGLSPLGVWVAARGAPVDASYWIPGLLSIAVLLWVAGFDILYSCQDVDFDRSEGLHSVPKRLGIPRALWVARVCHVAMIVALCILARQAGLGVIYQVGVGMTAALLVYEHRLVRSDDLSKIDMAFFTVNGVVSLLLSGLTVLEVLT